VLASLIGILAASSCGGDDVAATAVDAGKTREGGTQDHSAPAPPREAGTKPGKDSGVGVAPGSDAESDAGPRPPSAEGGDTGTERDAEVADATDVRHVPEAEPPIVVPSPFTANFLWKPITFAGAVDLRRPPSAVAADAQVGPGRVHLTEVGEAAGLSKAIGGGNGKGVGIAFVDVDGDDYDDIFVANGQWVNATQFASQLFLNRRDGTFVDHSNESGITAVLGAKDTFSVAVADYDADGDFDLYVTTHPNDMLLANDGAGHFTDVSTAAHVGGPASSQALARSGLSKIGSWGDLDGDGWLDIAVASATLQGIPYRGYLLRNKGDGTFESASVSSGFMAAPTGDPCAVLWTDYDNDGDQDVQIWSDQGTSTANRVLLQNDGKAHFTDVTVAAGLVDRVTNPMGIDGADIDRNGFNDYYISNIGGNPLFLGSEDGTFTNIMSQAGVAGSFGWGLGFEDLNRDSWPDIFVTQIEGRYDLTFTHQGTLPPKFTVGYWSPVPILYTGLSHNIVAAFADYDRDGRIDIVRATTDGSRVTLFKNDTDLGSANWLDVRIGRTPRTGERGGVSARVVVKTGDLVQFRDINGGSSRASNNATSARFGLGQYTGADWVAALWPDGRELSALNVAGNQTIVLSEKP
jgi:hypothetical protein